MDKLLKQIESLTSRLNAINEEQAAIETAAEASESGRFTEEQQVEYDALSSEYDEKSAELTEAKAQYQKVQDRQSRELPNNHLPRRTSTNVNTPLPGHEEGFEQASNGKSKKFTIPATVRRGGSLKNFKGERNGLSADERAYRFGMFALARMASDIPNHYGHFANAIQFAQDQWAISTTSGGDGGGSLVPDEFGTDLIDLREEYGVARRIFKRRPMSSDTRTDPRRTGGLTAYFTGEGAAATESTKEWDVVRLTAKKLTVISRYTNELSMDSVISIGDDLAGEISYAFANKEDECGFNGDGTSTYGGINGVRAALKSAAGTPTTDSAGGVIVGAGNLYGELTLANFHSVLGVLPMYARTPNTVWVCSATFFHTVMEKLMLASGGVPAAEIREGSPVYRFLGYPVVISQVMPTTEANSQVCALLGDFTLGASFGDRMMDSIAFSDSASVGGQSLWERNEIGIRGTERFDINVHDVGSSSAAGPIVGLQTLNS